MPNPQENPTPTLDACSNETGSSKRVYVYSLVSNFILFETKLVSTLIPEYQLLLASKILVIG